MSSRRGVTAGEGANRRLRGTDVGPDRFRPLIAPLLDLVPAGGTVQRPTETRGVPASGGRSSRLKPAKSRTLVPATELRAPNLQLRPARTAPASRAHCGTPA